MREDLTKEEKQVVFYAEQSQPTIASSVNPETPLSSLNLNWREKDLPERERTKHVHRLHPYLGKFIPQLVEIFLRKYFKPGQTVLDPFGGSGTTLVQANELGVNSIAYDISAFNVLLMHAKTDQYNLKKVRLEINDILERVHLETQTQAYQMSLWEKGGEHRINFQNEYLSRWFAPNALQELLTYRNFIHQYEYQNVLKIILSRAARSARLTTHFDLDFPKKPQTEPYWCYKHSRTCVATEEAFKFLRRYSMDTIKRIEEYAALRTNAKVSIYHGDSRIEHIPQIDGLITSPPYVGLIDYHEQHRYAYELFGMEDRRSDEIGPAEQGSSQKAKKVYQEALAQVFTNAMKSMTTGGYLIVVAGDKYGLYDEIAEKCGVKVEAIVRRHVNRRTGRRSSEFYEDVFIWRKPG
ncbi:MAG TPA: DNA methyltransferase [Anaerolineales bacterium]|nr:DNA methyltransferase [Anaerolineales bacterium]